MESQRAKPGLLKWVISRSVREEKPLFRVDPGWLYLIAGMALVASVVLIPAHDDLLLAEASRDRAIHLEQLSSARLKNHADFLDALKRDDPNVALWLAETNLNLAPSGYVPLYMNADTDVLNASVFDRLEPRIEPPATPVPRQSLLRKLTTNDLTRLWVGAVGAVCILLGLLPEADGASDRSRWRDRLSRLWPDWLASRHRDGSPEHPEPVEA